MNENGIIQMTHNIRIKRGKQKGKFGKLKNVIATENRIASITASKAARSTNHDASTSRLPEFLKNRRFIKLDTFTNQLWCNICNLPLSLKTCIGEKKMGLGTIFTVECTQCNKKHFVHTDVLDKSGRTYEVNGKLAFGIIDAGMGESQLNSLFSSIDVPAIPSSTLKRYERKVGPAIESIAEESCIQSVRLEKELEMKNLQEQSQLDKSAIRECNEMNEVNATMNEVSDALSNSCKVFLKASYDSGWQKRGTGHAYNSLSGHGTVIGLNSKKVLSYAVRSKDCRLCKMGHTKNDHDCRKNYKGSAKSMESDMALELFTKNKLFNKENVAVNVLVGDDDSSAIASVRRESLHSIEKWSDFNHTHKSFTSSLYALKLPKHLINYFSKNFAISVKKNKGDATKIESALQAVVPHAFGEHMLCSDWCKTASDPEYKHQNLPNGQALSNPELRLKLNQLFSRFIKNSKKIAECASTQANESLNNIIASKNPKSRHYGSSESLNYRIGASICQYNIGTKYSALVFSKMGYTFSTETLKFRTIKDEIRQKKGVQSKTIVKKKRRFQLKKFRSSDNATLDRREGITYESSVALNEISELPLKTIKALDDSTNLNNCRIIIYDLETSGFSKSDEILQIAACASWNESLYNVYVIPSKTISKSASDATGLQAISGDLYLHGSRVEAISAKTAVFGFINYLKSFGCPIVLLAHNGFKFDNPRMINLISKFGQLEEFFSVVKGFADSLPIFKNILPERFQNKQKFSIAALVSDYLPELNIDILHNGIEDVKALKELIIKLKISNCDIITYTKNINIILNEENQKKSFLINKASLIDYKENLSNNVISKIAKAGINKQIMEAAFEKSGNEGLRHLLAENIVGNKPRVTQNRKILQKIYEIFNRK